MRLLIAAALLLILSACQLGSDRPTITPTQDLSAPATPTTILLQSTGFTLILRESAGPIPAGAAVRISTASFDGHEWLFAIESRDGQYAESVSESLLIFAPDVTPGAPVPPMAFAQYLGVGGALFISKESAGEIPSGTRVRLSSAWYDGYEWFYTVVSEDEAHSADLRESMLELAPDVTPFLITPTSAFLNLPGKIITTEQVGPIPPNTIVTIGSSWFDGQEWRHAIFTEDQQLSAEARASQLAISENR